MTASFAPLRPPVSAPLETMTLPAHRRLLALVPAPTALREPNARRVQPVAMAAFREGEPTALARAGLPLEGNEHPELLSLHVVPGARRRGVGRALLAAPGRYALSEKGRDYGRRGGMLPLYSESINRMKEAGFTRRSFIAPRTTPPWRRSCAAGWLRGRGPCRKPWVQPRARSTRQPPRQRRQPDRRNEE